MVMGSSNLMMGLTLVLVVCLAVVLGLVLVLLAELYCSILLRRRDTTTTTTDAAVDTATNPTPPSLPNLYTQSILAAPRNILYPFVAGAGDDVEKQQHVPENQENNQDLDHLVYISNPMYDGDENGRKSMVAGNTPFETPDTSPSRLETEDTSSGDDDDDDGGGGEKGEEITSAKTGVTPPLTPMKKLPAKVNDGDGDGDGGGGDENSNNGVSSSSSSGTPCTSLSW
ncbi:hypothetical protein L1987_54038 [Smallanthus sonchifolius]|uniref:Uncharacterized protein n=1 Tax=Smallanthus sonchifolius TaxID=185202 RepID=A0ACB9E5P2_9ASTR|nr:hypothetical protein L1987_54038 [Smallanthus sonchifolius]